LCGVWCEAIVDNGGIFEMVEMVEKIEIIELFYDQPLAP